MVPDTNSSRRGQTEELVAAGDGICDDAHVAHYGGRVRDRKPVGRKQIR